MKEKRENRKAVPNRSLRGDKRESDVYTFI
jgi:hypothetical protein